MVIVALESFWAVGWLLAALIGYFVVPLSDDGWRWAFALGAVPALYSAVVRFGLPESVRFLERRGRVEEAERTVRSFEGPNVFTTAIEPHVVRPPPGASATDVTPAFAAALTAGMSGSKNFVIDCSMPRAPTEP